MRPSRLVLALCLVAGCGSDPLASTTADLTGTWDGSWTLGGYSQTIHAVVTQKADSVTGTSDIPQSSSKTYEVRGLVHGDSVELRFYPAEDPWECFQGIMVDEAPTRLDGMITLNKCPDQTQLSGTPAPITLWKQ